MRTMQAGAAAAVLVAAVVVSSAAVADASTSARKVKPTPGELIASEEFTAPEPPAGWIIVEQDVSGARIEDGAVVADVRSPDYGHRVAVAQPAPPPAAYAVEGDMKLLDGDADESGWGVFCRANLEQQYSFVISTDGFFAIYREVEATPERIDDSEDKAAQKRARKAIKRKAGAVNRIRGECLPDGELRMFVNGKFVTEATDPEPLPDAPTWGFEPVTYDTDVPLSVAFDDYELYDLSA